MYTPWFSCAGNTPDAMPRTRVLCIGDDPVLLASRKLVLCQAGYEASSCTSRAALATLFIGQDVVLICRSISLAIAEEIAAKFRSVHPQASIIRLRAFNIDEAAHYDAMIDSSCGPLTLVTQMAGFLNSKYSAVGATA